MAWNDVTLTLVSKNCRVFLEKLEGKMFDGSPLQALDTEILEPSLSNSCRSLEMVNLLRQKGFTIIEKSVADELEFIGFKTKEMKLELVSKNGIVLWIEIRFKISADRKEKLTEWGLLTQEICDLGQLKIFDIGHETLVQPSKFEFQRVMQESPTWRFYHSL